VREEGNAQARREEGNAQAVRVEGNAQAITEVLLERREVLKLVGRRETLKVLERRETLKLLEREAFPSCLSRGESAVHRHAAHAMRNRAFSSRPEPCAIVSPHLGAGARRPSYPRNAHGLRMQDLPLSLPRSFCRSSIVGGISQGDPRHLDVPVCHREPFAGIFAASKRWPALEST
jgi:hypothetical protein